MGSMPSCGTAFDPCCWLRRGWSSAGGSTFRCTSSCTLGCLAAGGEVSRLEIAPVYGGGWLSKLFPFVVPGGPYAGRLSGFDSHGSDWIYLATDLAPFALALFPGFWWLRRAAFAGRPVAFGAALPAAFAPLLSLSGDAYEIGSLATVHLPAWSGHRQLVGDDLGIKLAEIAGLADARLLAAWGLPLRSACSGR